MIVCVIFSTGSEVAQAGSGLSFESQKSVGAVLIVGGPSSREDALENDHYRQYILDHHNSWFVFAKKNGRIVEMSDLILVTGCDKTSNWACAAFEETSKSASATLQVQVGGFVQGDLRVWGRWEHEGSVNAKEGPKMLVPPAQSTQPASPPANTSTPTSKRWTSLLAPLNKLLTSHQDAENSDSSDTPAPNQCVFLRGYRVCDRMTWLWKRKLRQFHNDGFEYLPKPVFKNKKATGNVTSSSNSSPGPGPSGGPSGTDRPGGSSPESNSNLQPPPDSSQSGASPSGSQMYQGLSDSGSVPADSELSELQEDLLLSSESNLQKAC